MFNSFTFARTVLNTITKPRFMRTLRNQLKTGVLSITLLLLSLNLTFAQGNPELSDAEVAMIAVVANQIDISYAEIAKKKSRNAEVKKFAETMLNDHNSVLGLAGELAKKLGVVPKANAVSQSLIEGADKKKEELNSLRGKKFDQTYIDNEVAYHEAVINAVEGLLIPETENQELKDLLKSAVPIFKTHLAHAKSVQEKVSK